MKSNEEQLKSRGYVEDIDLKNYSDLSKEELLSYLNSKEAFKRTVAGKVIKKYKETSILTELISSLIVEKKLYTKIALSESIGEYGEDACCLLIEYLGKVGKNQYKELPDKPFDKSNYPLPRDIIARTICKIGIPALKQLRECLHTGSYEQILEAIDAIGFISYYENDNSCQNDIIILMDKYKSDNLMLWKLIRALQSFANDEVLDLLKRFIFSNIKQHQWEALRSIEQIQKR
ncbi:MAG: hypothetical protein CVV02_18275 [Firmicutes bacterium HGW-Firmicutes-7]|nr:MAG: hypothetical protein CVV02_18275 [Firmicutes bacterium HGW-Firmicutes-7]